MVVIPIWLPPSSLSGGFFFCLQVFISAGVCIRRELVVLDLEPGSLVCYTYRDYYEKLLERNSGVDEPIN